VVHVEQCRVHHVRARVLDALAARAADHDALGVELHLDLAAEPLDRHRVEDRAHADPRARRHLRRARQRRVEARGRQRHELRHFVQPRLADRALARAHHARELARHPRRADRLQAGAPHDGRDRREDLVARVLHRALHAALFVALARRAEFGLETVVRAETSERALLHAAATLQDLLHRRREIVEPQLAKHPAEELEGLHQPFEQRLARLIGRRVRERPTRVARAHEQDEALHAAEFDVVDLALVEVHLRVLARRVDQRHKGVPQRIAHVQPRLPHHRSHRALARYQTLRQQQPADPRRRQELLARRLGRALGDQQIPHPRRQRRAHRARATRDQAVLARQPLAPQVAAHRVARHPKLLGDRTDRPPSCMQLLTLQDLTHFEHPSSG